MAFEVHCSTEPIVLVCKQVNSDWLMAGKRQPKTHPAVAGAQIEYTTAMEWPDHSPDYVVIAPGPELPLITVSIADVFVRQRRVELFTLASSAFGRPDAFVLFYKFRVVKGPLFGQSTHDSVLDSESKATPETVEGFDHCTATRALELDEVFNRYCHAVSCSTGTNELGEKEKASGTRLTGSICATFCHSRATFSPSGDFHESTSACNASRTAR